MPSKPSCDTRATSPPKSTSTWAGNWMLPWGFFMSRKCFDLPRNEVSFFPAYGGTMKGNRRKSMKAVGLEPTTYGLKVCLEGFFARSKYYDEPRNSSESPGFL